MRDIFTPLSAYILYVLSSALCLPDFFVSLCSTYVILHNLQCCQQHLIVIPINSSNVLKRVNYRLRDVKYSFAHFLFIF